MLALACQGGVAQLEATPEYRLKANFLSHFPAFIDWPEDAFDSRDSPFTICVYGEFHFGTSLGESTTNQTVQNRKVAVRLIKNEADLATCQIIFVSRSSQKHYAQILGAVQNRRVLTVGETADFLTAGGGAVFLFAEDKLQFEVNLAATREAHLKVSARLLSLARRVLGNTLEAKG